MTLGILGGGQLGRMLALAGYDLGLQFRFLDAAPDAVAGHVGPLVVDSLEDPRRLDEFAAGLAAATYEFENVPVALAERLAQRVPVHPAPAALAIAQDRVSEKRLFNEVGLATPPFEPVDSAADLHAALQRIGCPAVLKTRRLGYDGKGQAVIRQASDAPAALAAVAPGRAGATAGGPLGLVLEGFVPFERELSLLAVRGRDGAVAFYPLVENHHAGGILRLSLAPAPNLDPALQLAAESHARAIMGRTGYVGVLAIEFFQHEGRLLGNEMAPRVHNSGHWTTDGAATSQFENHVRAVLGLPLGDCAVLGRCAMVNLVGDAPTPAEIPTGPGIRTHLYGKEPRPGRKVGHVNITAANEGERDRLVKLARGLRGAGSQ